MGTEISGRESQKFDPDQKKKFYPLWLEGKGKKSGVFRFSGGGGAARVIFHFLIFYHVIMLGSDL